MYYVIAQTPRYINNRYQGSKNHAGIYESLEAATKEANRLWNELQHGLIRVDIFSQKDQSTVFSLINLELKEMLEI